MDITSVFVGVGEPGDVRHRMKAGYGTFCGISSKAALYCWGNDILTGEPLPEPKLIDKGPWSQVGVGLGYLCALHGEDQYVYCYGEGYDGQLGDGSAVGESSRLNKLTPIVGSKQFVDLTVGTYHSCALSPDRSAFCWGLNDYGQLGTGDNVSSSTPLPVFSDVDNWNELSAGSDHTCGTKTNEEGWCWGHNNYQQVSPTADEVTLIPSKLNGNWKAISAGERFSLGIDSKGSGYGWGLSEIIDVDFAIGGLLGDESDMCLNLETGEICSKTQDLESGEYEYGNTGLPEPRYENPVPISGGKSWASISAGRIPCAIEQGTNSLYCWGYTWGEAYVDGSPQTNYPIKPVGTENTSWLSISGSDSGPHCGIQLDGSGWCWGRNEFNCESDCALGDGTLKNSAVPVRVVKIDEWIEEEYAYVIEDYAADEYTAADEGADAPSDVVTPDQPFAPVESASNTEPSESGSSLYGVFPGYVFLVNIWLVAMALWS